MVVALVLPSFVVLEQRLSIYIYYKKLYDDKICLALVKEGARAATPLQLTRVFVVITRWTRNLFIIFATFGIHYTIYFVNGFIVLWLMIINRSVDFSQKTTLQ
jgi:hypothetical protein